MSPSTYRFDPFELRTDERSLLRDGRRLEMGARAFDVLLCLIERRDRVVPKSELLDCVWPGLVVEENNLQVQVSTLRKLLGQGVVATIPGRGYRFAMALAGPDPVIAPSRGGETEAAAAEVRSNLPAAVAALIGRAADLEAVPALLAQERVVSIVGASGLGKTQLAREIARRAIGGHADGVWWVDLAAVSAPAQIAPAIAAAAGVQLAEGDPERLLPAGLSPRAMLLVLDNCEHLVNDVARVAQAVLDAAPGVRILATSQEALRISGEQVYRLDSLAVPPPGTALEAALDFSALRLLQARTSALDARFRITQQTLEWAIELCARLDGIPLAIEMAAARLPSLGFEALTARLGDRLRLLRSANRAGPQRHETLLATLDWSHSLLDAAQRAVLRRLAVFAGSFGLEAALRVARGTDLDESCALDALMGLVDKSLLKVESGEPPRYRLLDTTRLYAAQQLAARVETAAAEAWHGQAMAALSDVSLEDFWRTPDAQWLKRYAPDQDDLAVAFERAARCGDREVAAATAEALLWRDRTCGFRARVRRLKETLRGLMPEATPLARARILNGLSMFPTVMLPGTSRIEVSRQRFDAWQALGERRQSCLALSGLAADLARAGDQPEARRTHARALELDDPSWPPGMRAWVARDGSLVAQFESEATLRRKAAIVFLERATEAGSQRLAAEARASLADAALLMGEYRKTIALAQDCAKEFEALDYALGLALTRANLAAAHLMLGELSEARTALAQALEISWKHELAGYQFDHLALLAARGGRSAQAALLLGYGDRTYAAAGTRRLANEARLERLAADTALGHLGPASFARLREAGGTLEAARARALAQAELEQRDASASGLQT